MSITLKWDITYRCNLNCEHCINGDKLGKLDNELTFEEIKKIVDKLPIDNINFISILGGEPTARKDFIQIMQLFDKSNICFSFNTNGLILNNQQLLEEIKKNKHLRNIVFSLEGPNSDVNDQIRGKKVFEHTIKNIVKLIALKKEFNLEQLSITINTVLSKLNKEYIEEMIDMCDNLGVNQFNLLQMIEQGNAKDKHFAVSAEDEIEVAEKILAKMSTLKSELKISPRFTYPMINKYLKKKYNKILPIVHGCGAGTIFSYINNLGEVFPCDRYCEPIYKIYSNNEINLKNRDLYNILDKKEYGNIFSIYKNKNFGKKISPCNQCEYLNVECIPCPVVFPNRDIVEKCQYFFNKSLEG